MDKVMSNFADNLRKLLKIRGLKQKDIVEAFPERTAGAVNKWVNGHTQPNYEDLVKLGKFLGVKIDAMLDNDVEFLGNEIFQKSKTIPLINWVQAGRPTDTVDDSIIDDIAVPADLPDGCFALSVNGDFVIAVTENHEKATFKKFRERFDEKGQMYFELVPLNIDYPIFTSKQFRIEVIGVVRSFIRKL